MSMEEVLATWRQVDRPERLFGVLDPPSPATLRRAYRRLAARTHPDRHPQEREVASEAFKLLQYWYRAAQQKIGTGCYGERDILVIRTADHLYTATVEATIGEHAARYPAESSTGPVLLKIATHPAHNTLLRREAERLQEIARRLDGEPLRAHFPTLVEHLTVRDEAGALRQVNILRRESEYVNLKTVIRRFSEGVPAHHMVWIFNRVLAALGVTHSLGIVHGAILPAHILIRPADHNGMLIDWCDSVMEGVPVWSTPPHAQPYSAPELLAGDVASPATDLFMAAQCMIRLLGGDPATGDLPPQVPKAIRALLRACTIPSPARRASDAWEVFDTLHKTSRRLFGPPVFRPFSLHSS